MENSINFIFYISVIFVSLVKGSTVYTIQIFLNIPLGLNVFTSFWQIVSKPTHIFIFPDIVNI